VLRWINLALALGLAALLLVELTRSTESEAPAPEVTEKVSVVQETPGRRSRREEARLLVEERLREERERRLRTAPGPVMLDRTGVPVRD
jgi:hypothetical protein